MAKKMSIKFNNISSSFPPQQQNQSPPGTPNELSLVGTPFDDYVANADEDYASVQLLSITDEESEDNSESISDLDIQQHQLAMYQQLQQQQSKEPPKVEDEIDLIDSKIKHEKKKNSGKKMDKFMKHLQEAFNTTDKSSNNKQQDVTDNGNETILSTSSSSSTQEQQQTNSTSWLNEFTNLVNLNKLRNDSNNNNNKQISKIVQSESMDNFFDNDQQHNQHHHHHHHIARKLSIAFGVKNNNHPISSSATTATTPSSLSSSTIGAAEASTTTAATATTTTPMTNTFSSILDANGQILVSQLNNCEESYQQQQQQQKLNEFQDCDTAGIINNNNNETMAKDFKDKPQKLIDMFINLKSSNNNNNSNNNDPTIATIKKKFTLFDRKTFQNKNVKNTNAATQQDLFNKLISPIRTTTPSPTMPAPSSSITSALLSPVQNQSLSAASPSISTSQGFSNFLATLTNSSSTSTKVSSTTNTSNNNNISTTGNCRSASSENVDAICSNNKIKTNKMTNSKSMMTFRKIAKNDDNNNSTMIHNTLVNGEDEELGLLSTYLSSTSPATQNPTLRRRLKCSPSRNRTPTPDESTVNLSNTQEYAQKNRHNHRLSDISHSSSSSSSSTSLPLLDEKKFDNASNILSNEREETQEKIKNNLNKTLWTKLTSSFLFNYYIFLFMFISSGFFLCISPLPSFLNGFIFGFLITFFIVTMGIVYLVANFLLIKSDDPKRGDKSSSHVGLKRSKSKRLPYNLSSSFSSSNMGDCTIYSGWVYEFIGDYIEREKNGFVSRLVYMVLSGSKLNIFVPSQEMSDKKLKQILLDPTSAINNKNFSLQSQKVIDFSHVNYKRVCLYLTKNVRNQRKYIWSKKYPICIEFNEDITSNNNNNNNSIDINTSLPSPSSTPITSKLVIFARTCREKEEWFWAIKTSIDSIINYHKNSLSMRGSNNSLNDSPSESKTYLYVSSTGELKQTDQIVNESPQNLQQNQQQQQQQQHQYLHILTRRLNYSNFMRTNILNAEGIGPGNPGMMTALTWFNVLLNRLSFDILNKPNWSAYIAKKLQRKLRRLRLPYFMESLTITEIDIGTTLPKFNSVPSVPNVDDAGLWIEFDVNYSGGFTMTLETKINLLKLSANVENLNDISPASTPNDSPKLTQKNTGRYWSGYRARYRSNVSTMGAQSPAPGTEINDEFCDDSDLDSIVTSSEDEEPETAPAAPDDADTDEKQKKLIRFVEKIAFNQYFQKASQMNFVKKALEGVSNMSIMLTVQLNSLNGTLAINIPEPPTDRLWYGFRNDPTISITARPKLGDHDLNLSYVTNFIEKKLRTEFFNYFVIPNMDDFFIPSLNTSIEQYINVVP